MNLIKTMVFNNGVPMVGRLFRRKNKYINVIYYHDIVQGKGYGSQKTNIDIFKKHIQYLKDKGYRTYTFDELENNVEYSNKSVLITFDDGWRSNYTEIFSFMKEMKIKYNIYLEVGNVGNNEEYLTWDMIREMHTSGFVGFGAHTFTHPDMSDISKIDVNLEFEKANKKITEETGIIPKDFCYPFGKWSEASNKYIIENTDYERIYTSSMMFSYEQEGKIVFGRSSINGERPLKVFVNMVKGNYNVFSDLKGVK